MQNRFFTPRSKLLACTLLASAVLNLFLVGVVVGVVPGAKRHASFAPMALTSPHGEYLVDGMTKYLAPSDAAALRDIVQLHADALKQAHSQVRLATKDVASVFEQDPPDQADLQPALTRMSEAKANVNAVVEKIVEEAYAKLSPDGRHRLSELTK